MQWWSLHVLISVCLHLQLWSHGLRWTLHSRNLERFFSRQVRIELRGKSAPSRTAPRLAWPRCTVQTRHFAHASQTRHKRFLGCWYNCKSIWNMSMMWMFDFWIEQNWPREGSQTLYVKQKLTCKSILDSFIQTVFGTSKILWRIYSTEHLRMCCKAAKIGAQQNGAGFASLTNHFGFSLPSKCTKKSSFLSRSIRHNPRNARYWKHLSRGPMLQMIMLESSDLGTHRRMSWSNSHTSIHFSWSFRSLMHKLFSQAPLTLYPKQERAWKYLSWTSQPSWNIEKHCPLHPKFWFTTVWASDAWAAAPSLTLHRPRGKPFQLAWSGEVPRTRLTRLI